MNKKQFLELLIQSYGLTPKDISFYRTDGGGGQFEVGTGWKGMGMDEHGVAIIRFHEPDGFNMALYEILRQAKENDLEPDYISD